MAVIELVDFNTGTEITGREEESGQQKKKKAARQRKRKKDETAKKEQPAQQEAKAATEASADLPAVDACRARGGACLPAPPLSGGLKPGLPVC